MHVINKIVQVDICYIVKHPPRCVNWYGPVFLREDEVVTGIPCDPAIKPLFLIANETEEVDNGKPFRNYIVTDGDDYWAAAIWCTVPYFTVDVKLWPSDRDRAMVLEALKKFQLAD